LLSQAEYSTRAIDLVQQSTEIDMLGLLTSTFPSCTHGKATQ